MVSEATALEKWKRNWKPWFDAAIAVLESNAQACAEKTGLDKMACIAAKNSTTVKRRALGLPPKGMR